MRKYISQGQGRGIVYESLAKIYFRQSGKRANEENVIQFMQEMANESMESFTPNPLLGANPKPAISSKVKESLGKDQYFELATFQGGDAKTTRKKISSAVTGLTHAIMEGIYGIKKSDFNYKQKSKNMTGDQKKAVDDENRLTKKYRMLRIVIYFFLMSIVKTFALFRKEQMIEIFEVGGLNKLSTENITEEVYTAVGVGAGQVFKSPITAFYFSGKRAGLKNLFPRNWLLKAIPEIKTKVRAEFKDEMEQLDLPIPDDE